MRPRMEGSGCNPLAMERGAGCRGEERMVNGLKVDMLKRENVKKGGRRSKGIESTRDEEMGKKGACEVARAHYDVNRRVMASNAREGQEMAFVEDGVVGWARLGYHPHIKEQRWTLGGMPLKERERCDKNGNIRKDVQRDIATHPTQRSQTTSAGNYLIPIAEQTGEPHPSPIIY